MAEINSKNIPVEYRIQLSGKMNKGVFECINRWDKCKASTNHRQIPSIVVEDIIGFADSQWGWMVVWECKECGQKQFFHLRENEQYGSLDYVKMYHEYMTTGKYSC